MKHKFGKKIYQFCDVYTEQECQSIINKCETIGFSDIQTNKLGEQFQDTEFRNDQCCILRDQTVLGKLMMRIDARFTGSWKLHDLVRVSKYSKDSFCLSHQDGVIRTDGCVNKYTVLLYLNEPNGGETLFHFNGESLKIKPMTGTLVIFDRSIEHESLICKDLKYALRTDIMFPDNESGIFQKEWIVD